ncbi:hypothetical protein Micbo1qcDRAFT_159743 [Microdochium bolleyi]|uniref:Uncharacterized protein n=1 Tax=Microdochium bolleyi TaxID=196109 RepID=A0A136JBM8_9PEZI|nr:hypothetical protein Micbo1qcDRAFT_159743 [Microdochium bolleyi]
MMQPAIAMLASNQAATCRGFAHPLVLLVRSSLQHSSGAAARSRVSRTRFASSTARHSKGGQQHGAARRTPTTARSAAPANPTTTAKTTLRSSPPSAPAAPDVSPHVGYAQTLARKPTPTTLYEGARQRVFLISSYAAGLTLFGGAAINSVVNVYDLPEGVPSLVAYPFGFVSVLMAVVGARFAMTPSGIVRTIKVLPSAAAAASSQVVARQAGSIASAAARPQIEVMVRRTAPIPGLPLQRIVCEPHEIVMKARMYNRPSASGEPKSAEELAEEAAQKQAELEYERTHVMTAPFRHGWWAIRTVFLTIRQGITGEGFAPIEVKGVKYKLCITDGYALEEGRALDRIVQIDEDQAVAALRTAGRR